MCANDACGGSLSSCFQSSQSRSFPILLLASRSSFAASSLAALHALHPQNALLVAGPLIPRFFSPSRIRLWCAPCGTPTCCLTLAPKIVLVVTLICDHNSHVSCWGSDWYGQSTPSPDVAYSQISVGYDHTCGVQADNGHVSCWGANWYGQMSTPSPDVPYGK